MNIFDVFLINPLLNILIILFKLFQTLLIPGALGLAIILMTVIIRLALWPLTTTQLKSSQKIAALKPHLDRVKKEHGHDKVRHQQEVAKLYKEHGVNPLAGCLPILLQIPVFIALYQVLLKIVAFDKGDFLTNINDRLYSQALYLKEIPGTSFLGFNLSAKPSQWHEVGILILLIPFITGFLQFIQSKMLTGASQSNAQKVAKVTKEEKGGNNEDTMESIQSQMTMIIPAMITFFSYGFPVGLSLYWNTFTIVGIIQQYVVSGPGSLAKYLPEKWQRKN